jgi:hypothetical protein
VIRNVNAIPININGRVEPVFLNKCGTTKIRSDTSKRNKQKITMHSNHDRISELFIMYCTTGVNGSRGSKRSPANNSSLEVLMNCGLILLKPIMEKKPIYRNIVIGRISFVDRVTKTLLTPSGSKNIRDTEYKDKTPSGIRM